MGWAESSSYSGDNLDLLDGNMQIEFHSHARCGPIVTQKPATLDESRARWSHCLLGFLVDDRRFPIKRMEAVLRIHCHLRGNLQVIG